jgi:hypothetical protein
MRDGLADHGTAHCANCRRTFNLAEFGKADLKLGAAGNEASSNFWRRGSAFKNHSFWKDFPLILESLELLKNQSAAATAN